MNEYSLAKVQSCNIANKSSSARLETSVIADIEQNELKTLKYPRFTITRIKTNTFAKNKHSFLRKQQTNSNTEHITDISKPILITCSVKTLKT